MSVINTNIQAIAAARSLNASQEMLGRSLTRLSSGSKIVNPSDDAAGLAVSEKLDAQNRRVQAASTNVQNAISYIQTADGFMSGMTKILSRMSELAILAKDVTKNTTDVDLYGKEFSALQDQLRATIGGTVAQIGGPAGIDSPLGAFNGIALFGDDNVVPLSEADLMWGADPVTAGGFTPGAGMTIGAGVVIASGATFGSGVSVGEKASIDAATLGSNISIGASAYVGAGVVIEDNVTIGENAYIEPGVTLKAGSVVAPGAVVLKSMYPADPGATPAVPAGVVPSGTTVTKDVLPNSVTAVAYIVGTNMSLGSGVVIGVMPPAIVGGTLPTADVTLGDNVKIGDGVRIASSTTAPVVIGDNVTIGKNVYIAPGVTIDAGVTIPDGAVILDDVPAGTVFANSGTTSSNTSPGLTVTIGQAVGQTMTIKPTNLRQGAMLSLVHQNTTGGYDISITDPTTIATITDAIQQVASERASLGASQSRLELASTTLSVEYENLASAISRIRDVDVAKESTQYAKYNILVQSGTAMLAQANQSPQSVLKLLQS